MGSWDPASLQLFTQKGRYSSTSTQRAYFPCIMHGICSSWPLTHAALPPPCLRPGPGPPHHSHWEQLRAKPRAPGRWTGLPDIPAPSSCSKPGCAELAALTKSLAQFGNNPLPWAPLQGLTTLIGIFFPPLDQVVISSVPICACCLSSNEISLILFPEETQRSSPPSLHLLCAPGPGPF